MEEEEVGNPFQTTTTLHAKRSRLLYSGDAENNCRHKRRTREQRNGRNIAARKNPPQGANENRLDDAVGKQFRCGLGFSKTTQ